MADNDILGTDWSEREIELIVADYFDMLDEELRGRRVNKAQRNRALQHLIGRSRGSIEFKHQNISAVLDWLGEPWIDGYKPRDNYQGALVDGIERHLVLRDSKTALIGSEAGANAEIVFEAPPTISASVKRVPDPLKRLVAKFDPAVRDARNRKLGREGEERIFRAEISRLTSIGRKDLASKVVWTAEELGDGAGYDIRSFDPGGAERLLEVKTTLGHKATPFYISQNELNVSRERADVYRIVRIYDFARQPRAFEISPPLESCLTLQPTAYRAAFQ